MNEYYEEEGYLECDHKELKIEEEPFEGEDVPKDAKIITITCKKCGYTDQDILSIEYASYEVVMRGVRMRPILARGNISKCSNPKCGRLLTGTNDEDFPLIIFVNEGEYELDFCKKCFNELGFLKEKIT